MYFLRLLQVFISGGEYYNTTTQTYLVESTIWSVDLTLGANMAWRKLAGGGETLLNTTTQNTATVTSMAHLGGTGHLALMTPVVGTCI